MHSFFGLRSLSVSVLLIAIAAAGCKKTTPSNTTNLLQQYFDANILNQVFIINLATDNGTDLTSNYTGYTCTLVKTDYYHGPLEIKHGATTYSGTWIANDDYSKLTITLPSTPSIFIFLTRDWRFTSKNLPELDLAPWGTTDPVVLHILRQ